MKSSCPKIFLTIDVEDWFHLDYFKGHEFGYEESCLDGLYKFIELLDKNNMTGNFFFLDEIALKYQQLVADLCAKGHGIGSHGSGHIRPLTLNTTEYYGSLQRSHDILRSIVPQSKPIGYRAPCFSLDNERLALVEKVGFNYDSSYIQFTQHPLYGQISISSFCEIDNAVYKRGSFYEFEVTTVDFLGRRIPIAGGGYLRMLPSFLFSFLFSKVIKHKKNYNFFIHPFELSNVRPQLPEVSYLKKIRFSLGRKKVMRRIEKLMVILRDNDYEFVSFDDIISK